MMTDYILSPCSLAARGLSQLMLNAAKRPVELPVEGVSLRELAAVKRIVVYLPDDPLWMLTTLRQAARLLDEALPPLPMLILSRSPAIWLRQTLLYQVSHPDRLRNVHTAPADLSCAELAHRLENAPRLERLASEAALIHGKRVVGLTHAELKVILALLQGQTIGEQATSRIEPENALHPAAGWGEKAGGMSSASGPPLSAHAAAALTRKRTDGV